MTHVSAGALAVVSHLIMMQYSTTQLLLGAFVYEDLIKSMFIYSS